MFNISNVLLSLSSFPSVHLQSGNFHMTVQSWIKIPDWWNSWLKAIVLFSYFCFKQPLPQLLFSLCCRYFIGPFPMFSTQSLPQSFLTLTRWQVAEGKGYLWVSNGLSFSMLLGSIADFLAWLFIDFLLCMQFGIPSIACWFKIQEMNALQGAELRDWINKEQKLDHPLIGPFYLYFWKIPLNYFH